MKKMCPACAEETYIASVSQEILVVRSIKMFTSPVGRLCANHRHIRENIGANEVTIELLPRVVVADWQPIDIELVKDGYLARVTRQLGRAGRWRGR